jgi:nucleotide-binding universal stress UspA family protein
MYRRILVAYDGSAGARRALTTAVDLAAGWGSELGVLWVEEHLPHYAATVGEIDEEKAVQDRYFGQLQAEAIALGAARGVRVQTEVRLGQPARVVTDFVRQEGWDLLVLGRSGHSEVWGRFMGSTADKISRHASCAVLIVP